MTGFCMMTTLAFNELSRVPLGKTCIFNCDVCFIGVLLSEAIFKKLKSLFENLEYKPFQRCRETLSKALEEEPNLLIFVKEFCKRKENLSFD